MDPVIIDLTSSTDSLVLVDGPPSPKSAAPLRKKCTDRRGLLPMSGLAPDHRAFSITPQKMRATISHLKPVMSSFAPVAKEPKFQFSSLPGELRMMILDMLMQDWEHETNKKARIQIARLASVHPEWQHVIEQHTMREITVDLAGSMTYLVAMNARRRKTIRKIRLQVTLPEYFNSPCLAVETWQDKLNNNRVFRDTILSVFSTLSTWYEDQVHPDGIHMELFAASASDMDQCPDQLWHDRRWISKDIGDTRYERSCLDFCGNEDDSPIRLVKLPKVYVVTSFETDPTIRRMIFPTAMAEMIEALRRIRSVNLTIKKGITSLFTNQGPLKSFRLPMYNWSTSMESLTLMGRNTHITWRSLPHESMMALQEFSWLAKPLIQAMGWLKHLHIEDLLRIKLIIGPLWPREGQPTPFLDHNPLRDHTPFHNLVSFRFQYGALQFPLDWSEHYATFNENPDTNKWRQRIALGLARLALYMPKLRLLEVWQRPLMWAGTHRMTYRVISVGTGPSDPGSVRLEWESSFEFQPWDVTIEAWEGVAATNAGAKDLETIVVRVQGNKRDGKPPVYAALTL